MMTVLPVFSKAQKVTYSDYEQNNRDIQFEIIGKMKGNLLVYKMYAGGCIQINVFGDDMKIKETVKLDFMPEKTFNVDFVIYPDYFWMIYQYQKKNILHCMAAKNGCPMHKKLETRLKLIPPKSLFYQIIKYIQLFTVRISNGNGF